MSQPEKTSGLLDEAFLEVIRRAVREELREAIRQNGSQGEDRFLTAEEAAKLLSVSPDWLYRNARRLPFARKLGPKMLRFSYQGIQKYLATRKVS